MIEIQEATEPALRQGKVDFGGIRKQVSLAFTPEAGTGDYVLVHAGFALSVVDPVEAQQIFEALGRMDELSDLESP